MPQNTVRFPSSCPAGLADEPTGNLDNNNAWEIMNLLEEIHSRGTTVVVVTHNLEFVRVMKKRVIEIDKGIIVNDGSVESDEWEQAITDKAKDVYLTGDKVSGGFFDEN